MTTDPDLIDTIGEVENTYGSLEPAAPNLDLSTTTRVNSGYYRFDDAQTVSSDIELFSSRVRVRVMRRLRLARILVFMTLDVSMEG